MLLRSATVVFLSLSIVLSGAAVLRVYAQPDFTIDANPLTLGPLVAASGQTASSTITVTGLNGYTGTVSVSLFPSGLTTSLDLSSCSLSPSVTSCSGTLTVTAADLHGPYDVTVDATDGTLDHTVDVIVHVADFSIGANPNVVGPQNPGATGTSTITVTAQDEFTGDVSLVLAPSSSHLTASISPSLLTFTSSGPTSQTAMLSVSFDQLGTYTVLVTGQSTGYPSHSVLVTVLSPPTVLISPRTQIIAPVGTTVVYNVNVVSMPPFAGYDIMVMTNPALLSPTSIDMSASMLPAGSDAQCINGVSVPGSVFNNCTGQDGPGVVHDSFFSSGFASGDGLLFAINYSPSALDFSISANPSTVNVAAGQSGASTISITLTSPASTAVRLMNDAIFDQNGFTISHNSLSGNYGSIAIVKLKASPSASANKLTASPDMKFILFIGGRTTASATLTVNAVVPGSYSVVVTATLRYLNTVQTVMVTHSTTVNVVVT